MRVIIMVFAILFFPNSPALAQKSKNNLIYKSSIVAHPVGCPRTKFCGCGVSLRVYGERIRKLYLAANWLKFKKTDAAPGMVAARRGHVFYIEKVLGRGMVLAYDPNSGRRKTKIHVRSLSGFTVVDPREKRA